MANKTKAQLEEQIKELKELVRQLRKEVKTKVKKEEE